MSQTADLGMLVFARFVAGGGGAESQSVRFVCGRTRVAANPRAHAPTLRLRAELVWRDWRTGVKTPFTTPPRAGRMPRAVCRAHSGKHPRDFSRSA
eukprot:6179747-Prymnesium_polylepis.1